MDDFAFFGSSLPQEVRAIIPLLTKVDLQQFKDIVQCAVQHLNTASFTNAQLVEHSRITKIPKQAFSLLFTGIYITLRTAIRNKAKIDSFQSLLTELRFPEIFVNELVKVLQTSRSTLESSATENSLKLPQIEDLSWRIDVTISTTSMARVMKPSIIIQLTLNDGRIKTFEVSNDKFHELRYNMSKVLKEMEDLEKHPILKVDS
eukprot:TRINITY_DN8680_c0_g1_i1.p1 TRINITY_DN8680_c0_g1~~TRINITY_DN8680_c0_g1_i1.p1  ORF type:complete len:204 (+),score=35.38 TRINITY_DN8680_c0_g1_i1:1-612(+)